MTRFLAIFLLATTAHAGDAALSWAQSTENEDGTPLTDLAGYNVHYSQASGAYAETETIANPGVTSYLVENLSEGKWYFSVTAFDTSGNESGYSPEGNKTISGAPAVMTVYTIVKQENRFILLPVGTVPADTSCDPSQSVNGHYVVLVSEVTWTGTIRPVVVVADCQ